MIRNIFATKTQRAKCIVFYCFDYDRQVTRELFDFSLKYFSERYQLQFKYAGFYDEKYQDKYGEFDAIYSKMIPKKWHELVNFALDVENLKNGIRTIGVEFNITRPNTLTIVLPEGFVFDIIDFCSSIYRLFKIIFGFSYLTTDNYWAISYAHGDWQHSKKTHNIKRISRPILKNWLSKCEKLRDGYVRDIYNQNILHAGHLDKLINGESLKNYIENNNYGALQKINEDIFLWSLTDEELDMVRKHLYKTDIVI